MKKTVLFASAVLISFAGTGFGAGMYFDSNKVSQSEYLDNKKEEIKVEPVIVDIGRVLVPVQSPRNIKFVVANVGIMLTDEIEIEFLRTIEGATAIRNEILTTMLTLADTSHLRSKEIDTSKLSELVKVGISSEFSKVQGILLNDLTVTSVARGA
jgi:hypothetical protein